MNVDEKRRVVKQLSGFLGDEWQLLQAFANLEGSWDTCTNVIDYSIQQGWVYLRKLGVYGVHVS
jgi:hypothetical protein